MFPIPEFFVFKVNMGGPAVDDWLEDTQENPSIYTNNNVSDFATGAAIDISSPTIPPLTPEGIFKTERFSSGSNDISYTFPLDDTLDYKIYFYLAELFFSSAGSRLYDILIDGVPVFEDVDRFALSGGKNIGYVLEVSVSRVSSVDITTTNIIDNAAINAIAIAKDQLPDALENTAIQKGFFKRSITKTNLKNIVKIES